MYRALEPRINSDKSRINSSSTGLGAVRIADEDTLSCVGLERLAIVIAHEHVSQTAKNAEVGHIWFALVSLPGSIRDTTLQRRRRHPISSVVLAAARLRAIPKA